MHNFSTHTLLLRQWLNLAGIEPDKDIRIIVLPPEQMVDSLSQGVIDGFCVGEPWNSIAVEYGAGVLATTGVRLWKGHQKSLGSYGGLAWQKSKRSPSFASCFDGGLPLDGRYGKS